LFGVIILFGMLTGRTESVGVEDFLGGGDTEDIVEGADDRLSSSFFSSGMATLGGFRASLTGFKLELPSFSAPSFSGVTCVAILNTS